MTEDQRKKATEWFMYFQTIFDDSSKIDLALAMYEAGLKDSSPKSASSVLNFRKK